MARFIGGHWDNEWHDISPLARYWSVPVMSRSLEGAIAELGDVITGEGRPRPTGHIHRYRLDRVEKTGERECAVYVLESA